MNSFADARRFHPDAKPFTAIFSRSSHGPYLDSFADFPQRAAPRKPRVALPIAQIVRVRVTVFAYSCRRSEQDVEKMDKKLWLRSQSVNCHGIFARQPVHIPLT